MHGIIAEFEFNLCRGSLDFSRVGTNDNHPLEKLL